MCLPGSDVSPPASRYGLVVLIQNFNIRDGEGAADLNHLSVGDEVCVNGRSKKIDPDIGRWHPIAYFGKYGELCRDVGKCGNWATVPLSAAWATFKEHLEWCFDCYQTTALV